MRYLLIISVFLLGSLQVNYYVQSHIQINEYRDRVILVSAISEKVRWFIIFAICKLTGYLFFGSLLHPRNMEDILAHVSKF